MWCDCWKRNCHWSGHFSLCTRVLLVLVADSLPEVPSSDARICVCSFTSNAPGKSENRCTNFGQVISPASLRCIGLHWMLNASAASNKVLSWSVYGFFRIIYIVPSVRGKLLRSSPKKCTCCSVICNMLCWRVAIVIRVCGFLQVGSQSATWRWGRRSRWFYDL